VPALEDWIAAGTSGYAIEAARAVRAQPADDEDH
jgi:hypothetical protein